MADRTACKQYDQLKNHYCVISVFNAIHSDRIVSTCEQNVIAGTVIRARPDTEPGVHTCKLLIKPVVTSFGL